MAQRPIFLERESYRRRRLVDAAKLLPVLGIVLFLMPLLWAGRGSTAGGLVFLFIAWALLIFIMALLSRKLAETEPKPDADAGAEATGSDDAV